MARTARMVGPGIAVASASFASASHAMVDIAALAGSPLETYGAFAIAIAVIIVLLLWYAVDDGAPDDRSAKSRRIRHAGNGRFDGKRSDSDRHAA